MAARCRIVILGASGHFGGRLCKRLLSEPGVEIVVTSRSLQTAQRLTAELSPPDNGRIEAAEIDVWDEAFEERLASLRPQIVVHAVGPFQGQDYRVAAACIRCGCHYVDLADGRQFVNDFATLNKAAIDADVLLVSGASTLPGLSSAVLDILRPDFDTVDEIRSVISPAHQTPRGTATIAAVLSYCGSKFSVLDNGQWRTTYGWQDLRRHRHPELGPRLSAACDVPDLALLVDYAPGVHSVSFHAALESRIEQLALWLMSGLTRIRLVSNWQWVTPMVRWLNSKTLWMGSDRGGMTLSVRGTDSNGERKSARWTLTAGNNHGPEIPCIPAAILVRKMVRKEINLRGATPCLGLITLADFDQEARDLDIGWAIDD